MLLLLLHWPLLGPRRGQGRQRTFVWALLRARNFTWYPKVSFGIRLEARVMTCLTTPFYSGHLEGYFSWVSRSPLLSMWTPGPLETVLSPAWWPWQVPFALWCPALDAEDLRDRSRLLGLSFLPLHHPGLRGGLDSTPPVRARGAYRAASLAPWSLDHALYHSWCHLPCHAGSVGPPTPCGLRVRLPSNTDHSSHHLLPPKGLEFLSGLFVLKHSGVK